MRAYLPGSEQQVRRPLPYGNVQQAVTMKMTEFASFFLDEFSSAKPVHFQTNIRQQDRLSFQSLHGNETRAAKCPGAGKQQRIKELKQSRHSRQPAKMANHEIEHAYECFKTKLRLGGGCPL